MNQKLLLTSTLAVFGLALIASPAWAENDSSTNSSSTRRSDSNRIINVACMQDAVKKRDNAVITATGTYQTNWKTSLEKRRDSVVAAWSISEKRERKAKLNEAWKAYHSEKLSAWKTYAGTRMDSWKQYRTDRKACGVKSGSEDSSYTDLSDRSEN